MATSPPAGVPTAILVTSGECSVSPVPRKAVYASASTRVGAASPPKKAVVASLAFNVAGSKGDDDDDVDDDAPTADAPTAVEGFFASRAAGTATTAFFSGASAK